MKIIVAFLVASVVLVGLQAAPAAAAGTPGTWSALGSSGPDTGALSSGVWDFAKIGSDLYVAGNFENAGGVEDADYLARWNGSSWSAVGTDDLGGPVFNNTVFTLAVSNGILYAGGKFTNAAGDPAADFIASWNGTTWAAVGPNGGNSAIEAGAFTAVYTLAVDGPDVYVGGWFENVAGNALGDHVVKWNGDEWSALGSFNGNGAIPDTVMAILVTDDGVYAGGQFENANGNSTADKIAFWNGTTWLPLGSNLQGEGALNDYVDALVMIGSNLYVGGDFLNLEGSLISLTNYIARWDGTAWHGVGSMGPDAEDINGTVHDLDVLDGHLVAGGAFGAEADGVGVWDGTSWKTLGPDGAVGNVFAIQPSGGDLYAGGSFTDAAGIKTADRVALLEISSIHRPDGRIRKGSGTLRGNNIYNADAHNQVLTGGKPRGQSLSFTISVQNDGSRKERLQVQASGTATTMYDVKYLHGTTDITAAVVAGTFLTPALKHGDAYAIKATVKVKSNAAIGSTVARLITITSTAGAGGVDAVKFVVQRI